MPRFGVKQRIVIVQSCFCISCSVRVVTHPFFILQDVSSFVYVFSCCRLERYRFDLRHRQSQSHPDELTQIHVARRRLSLTLLELMELR